MCQQSDAHHQSPRSNALLVILATTPPLSAASTTAHLDWGTLDGSNEQNTQQSPFTGRNKW